jgi:electron transfer flavoprotein alpha subunit
MPQGVLVFAEQRDGNMKKVSLELLNIGKQLAGVLGGSLTAALIGGPGVAGLAEKLGKAGAAKVFVAEGDALKSYSAEGYSQALVAIIKQADPAVVLAGTTVMGRELLPRAAAKLGTGIIPDCVDLKAEGGKVVAKKPVYSGKAYIEAKIPEGVQMLSVRPNTYPPAAEAGGSAEVVKVDAGVNAGALKAVVKEVRKAATAKPDLTEAEKIVSGGRGMKDRANFKILDELADVIGATVGASRAAVDSGYADQSSQVGQTGKVVNPTLYIAAGISGAIQHLAGMRTSKVIVAINKDADAPIFQKADYGIVADLFKVVPALTVELKKMMAE